MAAVTSGENALSSLRNDALKIRYFTDSMGSVPLLPPKNASVFDGYELAGYQRFVI